MGRRRGWFGGDRGDFFGFGLGNGFVRRSGAEGFETVEFFDGAAEHTLGLGVVAEEQHPTVVADAAFEAFGDPEGAVLFGGDLDAGGDFGVLEDERGAGPFGGLVEVAGEEAAFEGATAEERLLGEADALDGEELLGVFGLVESDEVVAEIGDVLGDSKRTTVNLAAAKPCLREFWAARALPSGVRGPVERAALARLAARRLADGGLLVVVGMMVPRFACSMGVGGSLGPEVVRDWK